VSPKWKTEKITTERFYQIGEIIKNGAIWKKAT
jgi:hypothetical protein